MNYFLRFIYMFKKIILFIIIIVVLYFTFNIFYDTGTSIRENFFLSPKQIQLDVGSQQKIFTNYDQPMKDLAGAIPLDFDYKDYYRTTSDMDKDLTYYYNDAIDQSLINETSYNVINQIDPIDYGDVKTGLDKCKTNCKGICFEGGYTGTATCYPEVTRSFDWGTLYKNPTFTYGYNAWDNLDDIKQG